MTRGSSNFGKENCSDTEEEYDAEMENIEENRTTSSGYDSEFDDDVLYCSESDDDIEVDHIEFSDVAFDTSHQDTSDITKAIKVDISNPNNPNVSPSPGSAFKVLGNGHQR